MVISVLTEHALTALNQPTEKQMFCLQNQPHLCGFHCRQMTLSHRIDLSEPRETYWTAHPAALDSFDSQIDGKP